MESNAGEVSGLARFQIEDLTDLEWEPGGEVLAAANPTTIHLFSALTREELERLEAGEGVSDIAFSPDSVWLASGGYVGSEQSGYNASIRLWRGPGQRVTPTPTATPTQGASATSPTETPAAGTPTASITPGGPTTASPSPTPPVSPTAGTPQLTPTAPTATPTNTAQPAQLAQAPSGGPGRINRGFFEQIGALLAAFLRPAENSLIPPGQAVTPTPAWEPRGTLLLKRRPLSRLTFSPGSDRLVAAWSNPEIKQDNVIEFRSTLNWEVTQAITTTTVLDLAFSPDGSRLASVPHRYAIQVWDLGQTGGPTLVFYTAFTDAVNSVAFSADGALLATGHYDGDIRIWDLASGELTNQFQAGGVVESLAFHPEARLVASGISYPRYQPGQSGSPVQLWSLTEPGLVRTLVGHTNGVTRLAFSPDGSLLASASYDGSVWLWGLP
jgi:WD40 repeat protein